MSNGPGHHLCSSGGQFSGRRDALTEPFNEQFAVGIEHIDLCARVPRSPTIEQVLGVLGDMELLRGEVLNRLEAQENSRNTDTDLRP